VGTGRNLPYYAASCRELYVTGVDSSQEKIEIAKEGVQVMNERNGEGKLLNVVLEHHPNLSRLPKEWDRKFEWVISSSKALHLPTDEGQPHCCLQLPNIVSLLGEIHRILKARGRFRLLEVVYSRRMLPRWRQKMSCLCKDPDVAMASDGSTLKYLRGHPELIVEHVKYLQGDTHVVMEGYKPKDKATLKRGEAVVGKPSSKEKVVGNKEKEQDEMAMAKDSTKRKKPLAVTAFHSSVWH
jgi:SAM-dependent methyltransferase